MPSLFYLVSLFAFGTQVVLSKSDFFKFTVADVKQCEPVLLTFTGDDFRGKSGAIASLKVLPFNGTAVSVAVPSVNVTDTGVMVSFFPVGENVTFVATLDDSTGDNASRVSDILRVQPGPTSDCVPPPSTAPRTFSLQGVDDPLNSPRQCEPFTVKYNASMAGPPTVRFYSPTTSAFPLNLTSDDGQGTATYMMRALAGIPYLLLLEGNNVMETTPLLTVGGGTQKECLPLPPDKSKDASNSGKDSKSGLPQNTVIGLAIGGVIVALIACALVAYLFWERRNRRAVSIHFDPSLMEQRSLPPQSLAPSTPGPYSGMYVPNPPYTATIATTPVSSTPSWGQAVPSDYHGKGTLNRGSTNEAHRSPASSLQSFEDIEGILNKQEQRFRQEIPDSPLMSPSPSMMMATPAVAVRALPARGQLRDVPRAPTPESGNPFNDSRSEVKGPRDPRASSTLLQPPTPIKKLNQSHFSAATTSSFGASYDQDRISGVPEDVGRSPADELPPRRPLPSALGLGRGNGIPL